MMTGSHFNSFVPERGGCIKHAARDVKEMKWEEKRTEENIEERR